MYSRIQIYFRSSLILIVGERAEFQVLTKLNVIILKPMVNSDERLFFFDSLIKVHGGYIKFSWLELES